MGRLSDQASQLRADTVERVPGRLAPLIETRIRQLLGADGAGELPGDLDRAERLVVDVTEQFIVDVHGLTDEQIAALSEHYAHAEQVAIMFHLALVDGFTKLERVNSNTIGDR